MRFVLISFQFISYLNRRFYKKASISCFGRINILMHWSLIFLVQFKCSQIKIRSDKFNSKVFLLNLFNDLFEWFGRNKFICVASNSVQRTATRSQIWFVLNTAKFIKNTNLHNIGLICASLNQLIFGKHWLLIYKPKFQRNKNFQNRNSRNAQNSNQQLR